MFMVTTLNGSQPFLTELFFFPPVTCKVSFIHMKSYLPIRGLRESSVL